MHYWQSDTGGLFYQGLFEETPLRTFDEVMILLAKELTNNPICVETGTAYGFPEGEPYWNTTSSIVKRIVAPLSGHLYSVDLEDRSENIQRLFNLGNLRFSDVTLLVGDSRKVLQNLSITRIDLLCLDSGEDEDLLVQEYQAVQHLLPEKHYVLVDDIHNKNSVKYKKVVPLLKELGYDWMQVPTETGLFIASKGYKLPRS